MATKLRNIESESLERGGGVLRGFFRHTAVKAASFILCVVALAGVAQMVFYIGGHERNDVVFDTGDFWQSRPFIESGFLARESSQRFNRTLMAAGWYAQTRLERETWYRNNIAWLRGTPGIRYFIQTPFGELSNTDQRDASYFMEYRVWYVFEDAETFRSFQNHHRHHLLFDHPDVSLFDQDQYRAYFHMTEAAVAELEHEYYVQMAWARRTVILWAGLGLLGLLLLIHLWWYAAGSRAVKSCISRRWTALGWM